MLLRIAYTSRASRAFEEDELLRLCEDAERRNRQLKVTGLFLFDGSRFLQAMEGAVDIVEALMSRIAGDPRHQDVVYISWGTIRQREFPLFAMQSPCYPTDGQSDFVNNVKREVKDLSDAHLKAHFIGFAKLAEA